MASEQEIDIRAQGILTGLSELQTLLEEPITRHALDLTNNAKTAYQHDILNRTHRSLTQYLKLEGDLFYVGLLGHFSTGKSSTINSVLNIWSTDDERPTDLNPTDDTISLITRPTNEKYLLGVIREGTVTIRSKPIDKPLLDNIVLVDTPGTGDPELVEEIARDFLPICDVILFFFSAASPLDKNDMPLLEELHKRLPFLPIHFIVTRADELRRDILAPVSEDNIDIIKRARFFDDVLSRLNKLSKPKLADQIHRYELMSLERSEAGGRDTEGISLEIPQVELNATMPLMPSNLMAKWASLREAKVGALREAAAKLRKIFEEASALVQAGSPFTECEKIVQIAQNSLSDDLTRFFGNAELYRAGVFTHTTKESIGTLGLGKELWLRRIG